MTTPQITPAVQVTTIAVYKVPGVDYAEARVHPLTGREARQIEVYAYGERRAEATWHPGDGALGDFIARQIEEALW